MSELYEIEEIYSIHIYPKLTPNDKGNDLFLTLGSGQPQNGEFRFVMVSMSMYSDIFTEFK